MPKQRLRFLGVLFAVLLPMGLLAACGSDDDNGDEAGGPADTSEASGGESLGTVKIGYIPWDEDIAVTYLWKHVLEEAGYEVEVEQLDVAPTFVGVANGDLDLFFDTWLPVTHEDYWVEYGDQVEDLGSWYDNAKLTIAVPDYVEAESIADLADMADVFDGRIVGIEPGAGLTRVTRDEAMPGYGLDAFELVTSSTTAMLVDLDSAIADERPIVVTLWRPHWAYSAFDIRDLDDPEGLMGGAESIHTIARTGFSEEFPELAEAISAFRMSDEELASLEAAIFEQDASNPDVEGGVAAWVAENPDFVASMLG